jgi:hypothetical protein
VTGIEVKSGRVRNVLPGLTEFRGLVAGTRTLLVGEGGIPVEEFLGRPVEHWVG